MCTDQDGRAKKNKQIRRAGKMETLNAKKEYVPA